MTKIRNFLQIFALIGVAYLFSYFIPASDANLDNPNNPWITIGGCGAGGGGAGGGDGIRWIGEGVSGGKIEFQEITKEAIGQNFSQLYFLPHFAYKLDDGSSFGIQIPLVSKQGEVQYLTNQSPNNRTTGGLGDVSIDYSMPFGGGGNWALNSSLSLPTGQYDIARGPDAAVEYLPTGLQKGSGAYFATLGIDWTQDVDRGMWIADLNYNQPFEMSFNGQNSFLNSRFQAYQGIHTDRFYYWFKPYGENDLGDYFPPSISTDLYYAYRGQTGFVHSFGMTFAVPFGVAWIHNQELDVYDPRPDPDNKVWSGSLNYGLEFSRSNYPIFIGFSMPIHAKASKPGSNLYDPTPMSQWTGPDWSDLLQQWTLAVGIKGSFF